MHMYRYIPTSICIFINKSSGDPHWTREIHNDRANRRCGAKHLEILSRLISSNPLVDPTGAQDPESPPEAPADQFWMFVRGFQCPSSTVVHAFQKEPLHRLSIWVCVCMLPELYKTTSETFREAFQAEFFVSPDGLWHRFCILVCVSITPKPHGTTNETFRNAFRQQLHWILTVETWTRVRVARSSSIYRYDQKPGHYLENTFPHGAAPPPPLGTLADIFIYFQSTPGCFPFFMFFGAPDRSTGLENVQKSTLRCAVLALFLPSFVWKTIPNLNGKTRHQTTIQNLKKKHT